MFQATAFPPSAVWLITRLRKDARLHVMNRLYRSVAHTRARPAGTRYAAAAVLVGIGFVARLAFLGAGPGYPYLGFALPIIIAAVFLGRGPGLLATLLAAALAFAVFVPGAGGARTDPRNLTALLAFLAGAVTITLAAEAAFRAVAALATVLEGIGEPFYALDAEGRVLHASRAALRVWRMPPSAVIGRRLAEALPADEGSAPHALLEAVRRTRRPARQEALSQYSGRWMEVEVHPAPEGGLSVAFRDVHDRWEAAQRQRVLLAELAHRIKNTLALVLAIAEQTRRSSPSPEAFHAAFRQRLDALARAHDALLRDGGTETTLEAVLREALAPHMAEAGRLEIAGPEIPVTPDIAVALGMAFHELATNAAKHGALSVPGGRIRVTWEGGAAAPDGARAHALRWQEIGGPPLAGPPARRGFGTRLLERILGAQVGGAVAMDFAAAGLRLRDPLPHRPAAGGRSVHPEAELADDGALLLERSGGRRRHRRRCPCRAAACRSGPASRHARGRTAPP